MFYYIINGIKQNSFNKIKLSDEILFLKKYVWKELHIINLINCILWKSNELILNYSCTQNI